MQNTLFFYLALLLVILFLVMLARRLKISYPIVLVLGGLLLSFIPGLPVIRVEPELIFLLFLPPLLYEAAWYTSWKEFWKWRRVIGSFAFLIVILTASVIAFISHALIPGFTLALGFLLGAIISPPDAVSATSVLKDVSVPKRIVSVLEGESLLNDASSLIVFRFALTAVVSGSFVMHEAITSFLVVIIMGTLTGLGVALVFYAIHRWLPTTPSMDTVLTFMAPYVMYLTAEKFHFSGVLAVVSGGLFLSHHSHTILSHLSRLRGANVWATVGFALNGFIFMLIGLQLPVIVQQLGDYTSLSEAIKYGLLISLVVIITRLLCCFGASLFTRFISRYITTADNNPGWRGPLIVGWAGMRGVVSLASALAIPLVLSNGEAFPQRNLILFITFTVILVTLVFQGLTLPLVIRWVNPPDTDYPLSLPEQDLKVRKKLKNAALTLIQQKYATHVAENELIKSLKQRLQSDLAFLDHFQKPETGNTWVDANVENYREIMADILTHERHLLHQINKKAEVDEEIVRKHLTLLDLEEEKLRQQFEND
ncbi:Na+/H+ antiporter [Adhaeribacter pallidiroseus]|uniref:Sodium, potassium, lithium and rubidium/H(+) antiporter n=1 Tax=Adhaeribacter pallidiroseus TaxID=2072847 RepID=A0A369QSK0_9BACT|nr:Na+/H+ antiporter [Adhaeribacter pallidiroseus]RDC66197.1 Sodium, potassium, lithium and rubidium/H(+) antiporter [Adhaeribacter pallidiroseus]